jgi:thioredoxin reductase (NADPH)
VDRLEPGLLDVAVVGGGVAGISSAVAASALGLRVALFDAGSLGGQLLNLDRVELMLAAEAASGYDLAADYADLVESSAVDLRLFAEAESLVPDADAWAIGAGGDVTRARSVVVATGTRPAVPEGTWAERLLGAGVSYCASCDGPLYGGRPVGLLGGSPWTAQETRALREHAAHVVVLVPHDRAVDADLERLAREGGNIEVHPGVREVLVQGDALVETMTWVDSSGARQTEKVEAVFVASTRLPNSDLVAGVATLDPHGYVVVDHEMGTSAERMYAVGELRSGSHPFATAGIADGVVAATAIARRTIRTAASA